MRIVDTSNIDDYIQDTSHNLFLVIKFKGKQVLTSRNIEINPFLPTGKIVFVDKFYLKKEFLKTIKSILEKGDGWQVGIVEIA